MSRSAKKGSPELTVCEQKCSQCLFTPQRIVSGERAAEVIKECKSKDTYFVCHKGSMTGNDKLVCRGYYDSQDSLVFRLARAMGIVKFVPVPEVKP